MKDQLKTIREFFDSISAPYETLIALQQLEAMTEQKPVAAQHRFRRPQKDMPSWSPWHQCEIRSARPTWEIDSQGYEVEYRELYAAPVVQQYEAHLLSLLARIHRDGGHYTAEHGLEKSVADADLKVAHLFAAQVAQQPQAEAVPPDVEVIRKALERAFIMGQNYWADADSESYSANKRSDVTRQKFNAMRDEVCAAIAQQKETKS